VKRSQRELLERHRRRPWRVHDLAKDFRLLDVWHVPVRADKGQASFERFFRAFAANGTKTNSRIANALFALRFALGRLFRLDRERSRPTIADRLTDDDRSRNRMGRVPLPELPDLVRGLYLFDDEALLEIANKTIHGLLHLSFDVDGDKATPVLAIYIKSRGWISAPYMALITPFRHLFVYPAWLRSIAAQWEAAG
jgi:hypothetical protein